MLLDGKRAIVYGAGGAVGAAVARAFAREGAVVYLAGRTLASLDAVADEIRAAGGLAETAQVDALDAAAINAHADAMVASAGGLDISFNLISHDDKQGTPLAQIPVDDFIQPVVIALRSQLLTAQAAARHMSAQGSGVILMFGGKGNRDPIRDYFSGGRQVYLGGTQVAFGAMDVLRRQLAVELGPQGIRVVTLQSGGVPETVTGPFRDGITQAFSSTSMLKRVETLDDVGNVAAFAASDMARSMTATAFNITYGREAD